MTVNRVVRNPRDKAHDAMFTGHKVFAAAVRELRITIFKDMKGIPN